MQDVTELAIIQAAQTLTLLVVAGAVIYAFGLMRSELKEIRGDLVQVRQAFRSQKDVEDSIERIWKRIDDGSEELARVKRRIDEIEAEKGK